ncbi:Na(+)-translocating NADH-quinone reductase subunit A [Fluviibacterium sp. S390]|uniref:Na(+)-translocating NADH-quinone reductase subunit A n=1 Tax=Fluviibacterium sp. S390 TaxID=3415139 RepID=UPI003C79BDE4
MPHHVLKKGLDLPIEGAPEPRIDLASPPTAVAVIGDDTIGLKPKMLVAEGDEVSRGTPLYCHKDSPDVVFTAPMSGRVRAINRGARRVLQSVVIDVSDAEDTGIDFGAADPATLDRDAVAGKLQASGLWTSLRTRPYSRIPAADAVPAAIFVTAMDSEPLAPDARLVLNDAAEDFQRGLVALTRLTEGPTYLCQDPGEDLSGGVAGVETHEFSGPHPAGLAGTHMHFLMPPSTDRVVWSIGYQDVIAIGRLFATGFLNPERVISLAGPRAKAPRLLRTAMGASLAELIDGEIAGDEPVRVISGSILTGRLGEGAFAFLGRYARQVTLITEDTRKMVLGWITPQPSKYAVQPVLASALAGAGKLFDLTSNMNGGRRAMVPTGTFETLMPQDFLPTQLLRALLVMDTDTAQQLGALELDEEDLALCSFACPAKYEYGLALRDSLVKIEKEG